MLQNTEVGKSRLWWAWGSSAGGEVQRLSNLQHHPEESQLGPCGTYFLFQQPYQWGGSRTPGHLYFRFGILPVLGCLGEQADLGLWGPCLWGTFPRRRRSRQPWGGTVQWQCLREIEQSLSQLIWGPDSGSSPRPVPAVLTATALALTHCSGFL